MCEVNISCINPFTSDILGSQVNMVPVLIVFISKTVNNTFPCFLMRALLATILMIVYRIGYFTSTNHVIH